MLEKWTVIAQQISTESDPAKLVALVREANLLLHSVQAAPGAGRSMTQSLFQMATLRFDLQQAGNLHGGTQKDSVKYLFPGVLGKLPSFGQSAD